MQKEIDLLTSSKVSLSFMLPKINISLSLYECYIPLNILISINIKMEGLITKSIYFGDMLKGDQKLLMK